MNICIPISIHDRHMLPDFIAMLEMFGGLESHEIFIIPQIPCVPEAHEACARLSKITRASVIPMEKQVAPGWPKSCNVQFQFAAFQMAKSFTGTPWFWMELDVSPCRTGWANALAMEYVAKGCRFLGSLVPTQFVKDGGFYTLPGEETMLGVAVYHQALGRTDCLIKDLWWIDEPWDLFMRGDFKNFGWANSEVICDMWNTQNYRMEGDNIVCETAPRDGMPIPRPRGGAVPKSAYLIHGCKDGSLPRLILGNTFTTPLGDPILIPPATTSTISTAQTIIAQPDGWDNMGESIETFIEPVKHEDKKPEGLKVHVKKLLRKGSLRLGNLSKETGIPPADLKCQLEGLGFIVTNPGWIKAGK